MFLALASDFVDDSMIPFGKGLAEDEFASLFYFNINYARNERIS